MNDPAGTEFAVRYYRWAVDDMKRELREGFPFLAAIKDSIPIRATRYLRSLPEQERVRAAMSLMKRNHKAALNEVGESWGPEDERQSEAYREAVRHGSAERAVADTFKIERR